MGNVLINEATLSSIADAIREKNGATDTYKPAEMPQAIEAIDALNKPLIQRLSQHELTNEDAQLILATIAEGATNNHGSIGEYLFYHQYNITEITIPDEIDFYGNSCFYWCPKLAVVNLSKNTRSMGSGCFAQSKIETIEFPASLQSIDTQAFFRCENLKTVYFKGTPTNVNLRAFDDCNALTDIYVPWSEGEVANAPWGASSATIHYNYTE